MAATLTGYSIPAHAERLFRDGIIGHAAHKGLPAEVAACANMVRFEGSRLPSIPINWRFAESIAALKAFEATMINVLLQRKYGSPALPTTINTDHAQLLFMSASCLQIDPDPDAEPLPTPLRDLRDKFAQYFPTHDLHDFASSPFRLAATNIYESADHQFVHIHASLNPGPTIAALGLKPDYPELDTMDASIQPYVERVETHDAAALETLLNDEWRQACTIARTLDQFMESEQGRANAHKGLYEIERRDIPNQRPCWWPETEHTSLQRPLAGLKVVELTRIIAGPSIGRGLAELGASVMRVTARHVPDFSGLHPDLNWGKWNCSLDLRQEADRAKLKSLILDADVVLDGYRPGTFDKYGFGLDRVLEMCKSRQRGIIYARENTYGWDGPWTHRSGWQQISDANTGVSFEFGRAMGLNEPCTPVFPNSDYCTGVAGCIGVLQAVIERGEKGGSFIMSTALNYYSQWLVESCGTYPPEVWDDVWSRNGRKVFRHYDNMNVTLPAYLDMLQENAKDKILRPVFFEMRRSEALGVNFRVVRPPIQFPPGTVDLCYNVGTRGNGIDEARWPDDLMTEVVKEPTSNGTAVAS